MRLAHANVTAAQNADREVAVEVISWEMAFGEAVSVVDNDRLSQYERRDLCHTGNMVRLPQSRSSNTCRGMQGCDTIVRSLWL